MKVILIAAIIAIHGVLGYAGTIEAWTYSEAREVTLTPTVEIVLLVAGGPFGSSSSRCCFWWPAC